MFTCGYILRRLNPLMGKKPGFFVVCSTFLPARAHISTSSRLILVEAYWSDLVATCSTATEENESGAYVTVPCPSKVTQQCSTADWQKI